jgi:hypothetical protein
MDAVAEEECVAFLGEALQLPLEFVDRLCEVMQVRHMRKGELGLREPGLA